MAEALNVGTYSYVATDQFQDFTFLVHGDPLVVRDCWQSWTQHWSDTIANGNHQLSQAQLVPDAQLYWPAHVQEAIYLTLPLDVRTEIECLAETVFAQYLGHG
jgi:hypothetical protein